MSLIFQAIDWVAKDVGSEYILDDFEDSDGNRLKTDTMDIPKYVIKVFGKTRDGKTIGLNALNYTPHFYLKLPNRLTPREVDSFKNFVESKIPEKLLIDKERGIYYYTKKSLDGVYQIKRKEMYGFTNNESFDFLLLSFKNDLIMKYIARLFKKAHIIQGVFRKSTKLLIYESNIEPYLRFIHKQNIQPTGWIEVEKKMYEKNKYILPAKKNIKDYSTDWRNIKGIDINEMAPFIIASFDIECNSSHGDFPLAKKDYEKVAIELNTLINKISAKLPEEEIKKVIIDAIISGFDDKYECEYKLSKIYTKREPNLVKIKELLLRGCVDDIYTILRGKFQLIKDDTTIYELNKSIRKESVVEAMQDEGNDLETEMENFRNIFKQGKDVNNSVTIIIKQLNDKLTELFPEIEGDQVIQIGTTFHKYGERECYYKHIVTLDTCDEIEGVEVISVDNEKDLIKQWVEMLNNMDPDIITGYNILGFDFDFLYKRSIELNIKRNFLKINRIKNHVSEWKVQALSSSALGDNELKYVKTEGRVIIDVMKVVQRDHKLDSYKLDAVSSEFISGKIKTIEEIDNNICCTLDNTNGIQKDSFVIIGENEKQKVIKIDDDKIYLQKTQEFDISAKKWGLSKDDVSPKEIFECQKGSSSDRTRVAKYCVMDCALCNYLVIKLEMIANNVGMSNVCYVPLSYIFTRGQGIKIFSFVAKQCKEEKCLIPVLDKDWKCEICLFKNSSYNEKCHKCGTDKPDDEGFEGAIVLDPKPGIYTENPIAVLDYASLYPSSMISENISHDSIVLDPKYDNLPDYKYINITYDIFEGKGNKKKKIGEETSRFAQFPNNEKGILPRILQKVLTQRKNTRKKIEEKIFYLNNDTKITGLIIKNQTELYKVMTASKEIIAINKCDIIKEEDVYNEFQKAVLDGLQAAYKVTANSLYGQVGAKTSPIFLKQLAASTTATGRNLILSAKEYVEKTFPMSEVVYGDTDSVFLSFNTKERFGLLGKEAIKKTIELGIEASNGFQQYLKAPHVLEYEKTFSPFIIFSKKRYVGNLYEHDENKYKRKVMGLSLKRRDFANISKIVYGGIIDIILKTNDIHESVKYFHKCTNDILDGKYPLEDFIITKTLKGQYKTPDKILHKVLADRMAMRDKGSAPQVNDRVPFVYIVKKEKKGVTMLQGERIEDPEYIKKNNLKIDYTFYITNQIMNSVIQLYSLILEKLPGYKLADNYFDKMEKKMINDNIDIEKVNAKIKKLKEKEVQKILFDPYLNKLENKKNNMREITDFLIMCEP
jgi:DNA polymerase elongation subunit (family B)